MDGKGIELGRDPTAPITRRGVLTSLLTGKPMEIPEQDVVSLLFIHKTTYLQFKKESLGKKHLNFINMFMKQTKSIIS